MDITNEPHEPDM